MSSPSFLFAAPGRRGGGGRSTRTRSRAPPARSSSRSSSPAKKSMFSRSSPSKASSKSAAPAKAAPAQAAPAAPAAGGGGMMSGLGGMIMQGMAFGGGSAIAHRAVDAVAGPRQVEHVHADGSDGGAEAPAATNSEYGQSQSNQVCGEESIQFNKCIQDNDGKLANCQFYYDIMQQCQRQQ